MTDILNFFSTTDKIKEPRSAQIDIYDRVTNLFSNNSTKIVICAPTGIGKSSFAVTAMNWMAAKGKNTLVTSPLNELVDQYDRDYGEKYITTIKGRKHYGCIARPDRTCDQGYCQQKVCSEIPASSRNCETCARDEIIKFQECVCRSCIYIKAMKAFKSSKKGNTNFTLFQKSVTNDPELIIIDEMDQTEDFIRMHCAVTVNEKIDWDDFDDHILMLTDWTAKLETQINIIQKHIYNTKQPYQREQLTRDRVKLERKADNIKWLMADYATNKEPWCWKVNDKDTCEPKTYTTTYEPISTNRFLEPMLKDKHVIQMSATPNKLDGYEYIEVESPFPPEIRPWSYKPLGRMSMKHRDNTIPKLAKFLSTLTGKTIVHCVSYSTASKIGHELHRLDISALIQTSNNNPTKNNIMTYHGQQVERKEAVQLFKESKNPNEILLSVKFETGIDFPELDIINNVIAVLNWDNPYDPLVIAKKKYYGSKIAAELENKSIARYVSQGYGRVNRNFDKTTNTVIVCSTFGNWYQKNKSLFYDWFTEAKI